MKVLSEVFLMEDMDWWPDYSGTSDKGHIRHILISPIIITILPLNRRQQLYNVFPNVYYSATVQVAPVNGWFFRKKAGSCVL